MSKRGEFNKTIIPFALEEEEEEEEEPLLIYTVRGSPFRCKKLSVINGSPEHNNVLKLQYTYTLN